MRATGYHLQFQWQKDLSDFCDGGRCRGTSTDTLRILEVKKGDKGRYRCLVKNEVEEMYSDEALLAVSKLVISVFHVIYMVTLHYSVTGSTKRYDVKFFNQTHCSRIVAAQPIALSK